MPLVRERRPIWGYETWQILNFSVKIKYLTLCPQFYSYVTNNNEFWYWFENTFCGQKGYDLQQVLKTATFPSDSITTRHQSLADWLLELYCCGPQ